MLHTALAGSAHRIRRIVPGDRGQTATSHSRPGQMLRSIPGNVLGRGCRIRRRPESGWSAREHLFGGWSLRARPACDSLPKGVRRGTTGSWHWNKEERRILDITHPAVLARLREGIEGGWRLGANYIRIDNLHHPAGSTHPRTPAQVRTIVNMAYDVEDRASAESIIEPERVTGLVAHNNLTTWEQLITQGGNPAASQFLDIGAHPQWRVLPWF